MYLRKAFIIAAGCALMAFSGASFFRSRNLKEPVVLSPGVTEVKKLSYYFPGIKGTVNDANVYLLEGKESGGTVLLLGGSHPEEPAGRLTAWLFIENGIVASGRVFVVLSANRSATTATRLGGAYPPDFTIPTAWGRAGGGAGAPPERNAH